MRNRSFPFRCTVIENRIALRKTMNGNVKTTSFSTTSCKLKFFEFLNQDNNKPSTLHFFSTQSPMVFVEIDLHPVRLGLPVSKRVSRGSGSSILALKRSRRGQFFSLLSHVVFFSYADIEIEAEGEEDKTRRLCWSRTKYTKNWGGWPEGWDTCGSP